MTVGSSCVPSDESRGCMPLSLVKQGSDVTVCSVHGSCEARAHLETLGFVAGAHVHVTAMLKGNLIVQIKGSSFGIGKEVARKIYIR